MLVTNQIKSLFLRVLSALGGIIEISKLLNLGRKFKVCVCFVWTN